MWWWWWWCMMISSLLHSCQPNDVITKAGIFPTAEQVRWQIMMVLWWWYDWWCEMWVIFIVLVVDFVILWFRPYTHNETKDLVAWHDHPHSLTNPMASVATNTVWVVSLGLLNLDASYNEASYLWCHLIPISSISSISSIFIFTWDRTMGGRDPYTKQHLWDVVVSISRWISKISLTEKATMQSPSFT